MMQNSNTLNIVLKHLCLSYLAIQVIKCQGDNNYNIHENETSFKIILCILMVLYVEMRLQL
jgi:hypothetical protein